MDNVKVEVRGVKELGRAFKKIDVELPRELKARFMGIAETVAKVVRGKMPYRSGRAAGSVTPRSSGSKASIAVGGRKAEYYPWLDFGGRVGRNRSIARDLIPGGRYLYPAIAEQKDETAAAAEKAIEEVSRKAGFETRTGS